MIAGKVKQQRKLLQYKTFKIDGNYKPVRARVFHHLSTKIVRARATVHIVWHLSQEYV